MLVNGSCYYFESTTFNYSDAKANCFAKSGKLFEPKTPILNQAVYEQSLTVSGMTDERWIGINSYNSSDYHFDSNGQNIPFNINHMWHANDDQDPTHNCVLQSESSPLWYDRSCSTEHQSICEINLLNEPNSCDKLSLHYKLNELQTSIEKVEGEKKYIQ